MGKSWGHTGCLIFVLNSYPSPGCGRKKTATYSSEGPDCPGECEFMGMPALLGSGLGWPGGTLENGSPSWSSHGRPHSLFFFLLIEKLTSSCQSILWFPQWFPKKLQINPWSVLKPRFSELACFPKPMRGIERVRGRRGCEQIETQISFPCIKLLHNGTFCKSRDYVRHKSNDSKSKHFICQSN